MLIKVSDIEFESELNDFKKVIQKCEACTALATLKQISNSEKNRAEIELQSISCEVNAEIRMDEAFIRFFIKPKFTGGLAELKRIRSLWKTALERQTSRLLENKPNDYAFLLELSHVDENERDSSQITTYLFSGLNPMIISIDEEELVAIYAFEQPVFGIESYSISELDYEEEVEHTRVSTATVLDFDDEEENFDEEFDEESPNEEVISNDDILDLVDDD